MPVSQLAPPDFALLFAHTPTPYAVLDLNFVVCEVNLAFQQVTGRSREQLIGRRLGDDSSTEAEADGTRALTASLIRARDSGEIDTMAVQRHDLLDLETGEFRERYWSAMNVPVLQDGKPVWLLHRTQDVTDFVLDRRARSAANGHHADAVPAMDDAEADLYARSRELARVNRELRLARDQLQELALRDPLTGLLVRSVFLEATTAALARLHRHGHSVGMLFVDLDRLKFVNDTYGHAVGDDLLRCCADRLRASIRPSDLIGRIGGDEFVVLLDELAGEAEADAIAQRVLGALSEPCTDLGKGAPPVLAATASIGVSVADQPGITGDTLMSRADAAMYRAKANGRGRVERFDEMAHAVLSRRNQTEAELRSAVHADQLRLHYQPILDLASGEPYAVEALLRWHHPQRGLLSAGEFLDVAEESSLIVELGKWVLGEACRQLADWDANLGEAAPRHMFINLSSTELSHPGLGEVLAGSVEQVGIDPERLVLEITEHGLLERDRTGAATESLLGLGCELAIDDFGTGYSSLSRLINLPARILKIDQSFVRGLANSPESVAVVSAVLLLGHNLRKTVVAEGVEDEQSLEILRELGCNYAQGFHLARPTAAIDLTERLSQTG